MDLRDSIARIAASKRILVLGSSGSGKTTFAIRLARILGLTAVHLDAHFWKPGWIATSQSEWRSVVSRLIQEPTWVMDGTFENSLDLRIPAADSIIVIERSRWICLWRVLKRKWTVDDQRRPDAPGGQKLDRAFFRYIWRYPAVTQPFVMNRIRQYGADTPRVHLTGSHQIEKFLRQMEQVVQLENEGVKVP